MTTRSYCTVFDKNYLFQGVALYESLTKFSRKFNLYVLCMDDVTYDTIQKLRSTYQYLSPISLNEILDEQITKIKERTTHGQFCWVCQPLICEYLINNLNVSMITYLEADSIFLNDPEILFDELAGYSVSLVAHNFSRGFDNSMDAGVFCTQFNVFKNDLNALKVLNYWKRCCFLYDKDNPNEYPGQFHLNDWPKFDGVRVIQHSGAGVAPWNIQHRVIKCKDEVFYVDNEPIIFFHFHQYGRLNDMRHELGTYPLSKNIVNSIYCYYIKSLREAERKVKEIVPYFNCRRLYSLPPTFFSLIQAPSGKKFKLFFTHILRILRFRNNIYNDSHFK